MTSDAEAVFQPLWPGFVEAAGNAKMHTTKFVHIEGNYASTSSPARITIATIATRVTEPGKNEMKKIIKSLISKMGYEIYPNTLAPRHRVELNKSLERILDGSGIFMDIGANEGQTTSMLLNNFPKAQIYAFEPDPRAANIYRKTFQQNENVQLFEKAVTENSGLQSFNLYPKSYMSSVLTVDQEAVKRQFSWHDNEVFDVINVEGVSIDDFKANHSIQKIELLKLDLQGYDLFALRGASQSLSRGDIKTVMVEMNFSEMYTEQGRAIDIVGYLDSHQYRLNGLYEIVFHDDVISWCTAVFINRKS